MSNKTWNVIEGSPGYEIAFESLLILLSRANHYVTKNQNVHGMFPGRKKKRRTSQKKQRI